MMHFTQDEYRDLMNALDALRAVYGSDTDLADQLFAQYAPGTDGHARTLTLYNKLSEMVKA